MITEVPKPSGKISIGELAEDLGRAHADALKTSDDPWHAVARRAVHLVPMTLPEETEVPDGQQER